MQANFDQYGYGMRLIRHRETDSDSEQCALRCSIMICIYVFLIFLCESP